MMKLFDYFSENWQEVLNYSIEHIKLTAIANQLEEQSII